MGEWWKRNAGRTAIVLALVTLVLGVVVMVQAVTLHAQGSRLVMGTFPEWVSAVGTAIAAIGVLAAFGTLQIGRREWELEQNERRDQLANQARLIVVEAVPVAQMVPPANLVTPRPDGLPEYRYVVIRNHSQEPIFNVHIPHESPKKTPRYSVTTVTEVVSQHDARGSVIHPEPTIIHNAVPRLVPVLAPSQATFQLHLPTVPRDEQPTEYVLFTFTDARGAKWRRMGSDQPERVFD